jgi:hypothetical protein
MEFKIEKDVPVPARGHSSDITLVLHQLEPGDSVVLPGPIRTIRNTVANVRKKTHRQFTTRELEDGSMRVWRVE